MNAWEEGFLAGLKPEKSLTVVNGLILIESCLVRLVVNQANGEQVEHHI